MSRFSDFHFIYPYWFTLLPVVLLLAWWLTRNKAGGQAWQHFIDERLRPFVISGESQGRRHWLHHLVLLGSVLAIIALAGPSWQKRELPAFQTQQGLVLGLDLSSSMLADDVTPNRLVRARFKLMDLLNIRKEGQTGLVVFAGDAFAVVPLTDDRENIIEQVKNLSPGIMPAQGSLVYRGIDESVELLQQAGYSNGDILMIADGVFDLSRTLRSAERAKAAGYRVSVAAIGTEKPVVIPLSPNNVFRDAKGQPITAQMSLSDLQKIAEQGGGVFRSLGLGDEDIEQFQQFFQMDDSPLLKDSERAVEHWQNEGIWLLWLLLPFGLLLFRKGYFFSVVLASFVGVGLGGYSQSSYAFTWDDLWLNKDQQAHKALLNNDAERARMLFQSPEWRAAATYRSGDFAASAAMFGNQQTATAHYNRGTALAKAGKFEEAIKAYDQALALQPDHEDAKFNRSLSEKMRDQQQNQQDQNSQGQDSQSQDSQSQDSQSQDSQSQDSQSQDSQSQDSQSQDSKNQEQVAKEAAEQQAKEQAKKDAAEQAKAAQEARQQAEDEASPEQGKQTEGQAHSKDSLSEEEKATAKQTEQWLYQIPDDSSGLWRRKFRHQYRQRQTTSSQKEVPLW